MASLPPAGVVEVLRDRHGIPHIRGGSIPDLAYGQGWACAVDRTWQLELERRRVTGTLAALMGPQALEWDVFARQVGLTRLAESAYAQADPETQQLISAYARGVTVGNTVRPCAELAELQAEPVSWEPWTPLAVFWLNHVLFSTFPTKLWRAALSHAHGPEAVRALLLDGAHRAPPPLADLTFPYDLTLPVLGGDGQPAGSNAWAIGGTRTRSGRPLLAGDPHRLLEMPNTYLQVHLAAPGVDVAGLAFAGVPGVPHFGHAGTVAWGITNAMADYQDLRVEQLRATPEGLQARGPHGWEATTSWTEEIEVRGAQPVQAQVIVTSRGPVVTTDPPLSLSSPAQRSHDLGARVLLDLLTATTTQDVDVALDGWVEPVNSVVIADRHGAVLLRTAGQVPVRQGAARWLPVPAWIELPHTHVTSLPKKTVDPEAHLVTANQRWSDDVGPEFCPPYRAQRIDAMLQGRSDLTVEDMAAIHRDTTLLAATPLLDRIGQLQDLSPHARKRQSRLQAWDRRMDASSESAALFAAVRSLVVQAISPRFALDRGADLFAPWCDVTARVALGLDALLAQEDLDDALRQALEDAEPASTWGQTHGLDGDTDCVCATSSVPGVTDACTRGPVARWAWDLEDRDASGWVVPHGAAGDPSSPHHADQREAWTRGELLLLSTDWVRLTADDPRPTTLHTR